MVFFPSAPSGAITMNRYEVWERVSPFGDHGQYLGVVYAMSLSEAYNQASVKFPDYALVVERA